MAQQQRAIDLDTPARIGAVNRILDAADHIANQAAAVAEIRALHRRGVAVPSNCSECAVPYPCPTANILERHGQ